MPRLTLVGVLLTFVLLVQFATALADLEERSRRGDQPVNVPLRALFFQPRRIVEVLVDFGSICTAFLAAYVLQVDGLGSPNQKAVFLAALPILVGTRYLFFVSFGVYRRVWRFAGARDATALALAVFLSAPVALGLLLLTWDLGDFPHEIFFVDPFICLGLVGASRFALRLLPRLGQRSLERNRVLLVGAGRSGRSLARELNETPGERVVGFLDDNPRLRRRRLLGVTVLGGLGDTEHTLASIRADEVLVTIPDAPPERLQQVTDACSAAGVQCRFVRREAVAPPLARVTIK
jgi:FlaA1/EpsC-like NDP-sugar epimerase